MKEIDRCCKKYFNFFIVFIFLSFFCEASAVVAQNIPSPLKQKIGTVYLTFDADMTPHMKDEAEKGKVGLWYSPGIISYLEEREVPATIFTTGMFAEMYPGVIRAAAMSGLFSIQNHTYDHAAFTVGCYGLSVVTQEKAKTEEIKKATEIITDLTGNAPTYVRLPGLCRNKSDSELIKKLGYKESDDGIISEDPHQMDAKKIVAMVLGKIKPGDNIVIMHLGGPNAPKTEEALTKLIPILSTEGYDFAHL